MNPAFRDVCRKPDCMDLMNKSCDKVHGCGHACNGFAGEQICLPCLHEDCVAKDQQKTLGSNADSYCIICYTQGLGEAPSVQLTCKHIFHVDCIS